VIPDVDRALRNLFKAEMSELGAGTAGGVANAQIGFMPPDADWDSIVSGLAPKKALSIYLVDLRENRELRSNEWLERADHGVVQREPAPTRVDCHYLISAWSGATDKVAKTREEHVILSEALEVLVRAGDVNVGGKDLPTGIVPPEGFPKLAEFWGTMAQKHRWKPTIVVVVTIPVQGATEIAGVEVTTQLTEYRQDSDPESAELQIQIAGVVLDKTYPSPMPIARAWVRLEDSTGPLEATRTNADGEFTFLGLLPGNYQLRVRADGRAEPAPTPITVPSPSGRYDLEFT
jgi:Pvc16 N-terminal domain/Carboxypeptidase regulatory-like domain